MESYRVEVRKSGKVTWHVVRRALHENRLTIEGPKTGDRAYVRVRASSDAGAGPWSVSDLAIIVGQPVPQGNCKKHQIIFNYHYSY